MANEKELKTNELTDEETEKVVGGSEEDKDEYKLVKGVHKCAGCGLVIMGTAVYYQGKYYHKCHSPVPIN